MKPKNLVYAAAALPMMFTEPAKAVGPQKYEPIRFGLDRGGIYQKVDRKMPHEDDFLASEQNEENKHKGNWGFVNIPKEISTPTTIRAWGSFGARDFRYKYVSGKGIEQLTISQHGYTTKSCTITNRDPNTGPDELACEHYTVKFPSDFYEKGASVTPTSIEGKALKLYGTWSSQLNFKDLRKAADKKTEWFKNKFSKALDTILE